MRALPRPQQRGGLDLRHFPSVPVAAPAPGPPRHDVPRGLAPREWTSHPHAQGVGSRAVPGIRPVTASHADPGSRHSGQETSPSAVSRARPVCPHRARARPDGTEYRRSWWVRPSFPIRAVIMGASFLSFWSLVSGLWFLVHGGGRRSRTPCCESTIRFRGGGGSPPASPSHAPTLSRSHGRWCQPPESHRDLRRMRPPSCKLNEAGLNGMGPPCTVIHVRPAAAAS